MSPTCVAPRHVDAPRDLFIYLFIFSPNEQRNAGGRCQTFYFYFFPCSADHERDWPPCKVVFFGLATNALNVRNNNNNNLMVFMYVYVCIKNLVSRDRFGSWSRETGSAVRSRVSLLISTLLKAESSM